MEPRALHVLGKQSNTELDAQPINLCFCCTSETIEDFGGVVVAFTSEFVNTSENCSLGSWNSKEMSILICKVHPDETRREGCFSFYSPPFLIWWPAPQWLLPKRSSCSCRNLREREREGGKVGKVTDRRAQDPALEARYFESHSASTMCQLTIQNKLFNPSPYCFPHVLPWKIGIALASTSWGAAEDKTDWVLGKYLKQPSIYKIFSHYCRSYYWVSENYALRNMTALVLLFDVPSNSQG